MGYCVYRAVALFGRLQQRQRPVVLHKRFVLTSEAEIHVRFTFVAAVVYCKVLDVAYAAFYKVAESLDFFAQIPRSAVRFALVYVPVLLRAEVVDDQYKQLRIGNELVICCSKVFSSVDGPQWGAFGESIRAIV